MLPVIDFGGIKMFDATGLFPDKRGGAGYNFPARNKSQINGLAFHHDTAPFFSGDANDEISRMALIYRLHSTYYTNGYPSGVSGGSGGQWDWSGIGYHGCIFPSGRIYLVGGLETMRAHVANHNDHLTGFVLAGNFSQDPPLLGSLLAAGNVLKAMRNYYGFDIEYRGHREWVTQAAWATECPGDTFEDWLPKIRQIADAKEVDLAQEINDRIRTALAPNVVKINQGLQDVNLTEMQEASTSLKAQVDWLIKSK